MGGGGSGKGVTVRQACEDYVAELREKRSDASADDAAGRFRRWIYGTKLADTPLLKLTQKAIADWRTRLAATKVQAQDKTKAATKPRAQAPSTGT